VAVKEGLRLETSAPVQAIKANQLEVKAALGVDKQEEVKISKVQDKEMTMTTMREIVEIKLIKGQDSRINLDRWVPKDKMKMKRVAKTALKNKAEVLREMADKDKKRKRISGVLNIVVKNRKKWPKACRETNLVAFYQKMNLDKVKVKDRARVNLKVKE